MRLHVADGLPTSSGAPCVTRHLLCVGAVVYLHVPGDLHNQLHCFSAKLRSRSSQESGAACMGARLCIKVGTFSCCRGAAMQALTCFGGQILGDFIAQAATTGGFAAVGFDWHRSIALSSFAAIIGGVQLLRTLWCSAHHNNGFCGISRCRW